MKYSWIIIMLILCSSCNNDTATNKSEETEQSQYETLKIDDGEKVYTVVDEMPRLTGCGDAFNKKACSEEKLLQYLYSNVKYDVSDIKDDKIEIGSRMVFSFVVEKDGTTSNFEVIKGVESISNIRSVIDSMPLWIPGKLNGVAKRVKMHLPMRVRFQ